MSINQILDKLKQSMAGQSRSRLALLGVMLVLLVLSMGRYGLSIYDGYQQRIQNDIQAEMTRLNSMSSLLADAEKHRTGHAVVSEFENEYVASRLIQASTLSLAEAQFHNLVDDLATEAGLNVRSLRVMSRSTQGDITSLKIGVECRGEIEAIKNFLQKADSHDKFIFVENFETRIINRREDRHFNFNAELTAWTKS